MPNDLYMRGFETDRAAALEAFRKVLEVSEPSDDVHQKARARIKELGAP